MIKLAVNNIIQLIYVILNFILYEEEECFISKEGWEILDDPIKRIKLHEMIEHYHKTGVWDFKILE